MILKGAQTVVQVASLNTPRVREYCYCVVVVLLGHLECILLLCGGGVVGTS